MADGCFIREILSLEHGGGAAVTEWGACSGAASDIEVHRHHNVKTQRLAVSVTGMQRVRIARTRPLRDRISTHGRARCV